VQLAGADDGDVPGEDPEVERGELGHVAHAAVDHEPGQAALLRRDGEHLAPVAVSGALEVGHEDAAGWRPIYRAVQREVVAADALDGEGRVGDTCSAPDGA
jgi:hypothetical protein